MSDARQLRLMLGLMLLMWITCSVLTGEYVFRGISSKSWPQTGGIVTTGAAGSPTGLQYRYSVDKTIYEGRRQSFKLGSPRLSSKLPAETKIKVYVHPSHPKISVLDPGTDVLSVSLLTISAVAVLISGGALYRASRNVT